MRRDEMRLSDVKCSTHHGIGENLQTTWLDWIRFCQHNNAVGYISVYKSVINEKPKQSYDMQSHAGSSSTRPYPAHFTSSHAAVTVFVTG